MTISWDYSVFRSERISGFSNRVTKLTRLGRGFDPHGLLNRQIRFAASRAIDPPVSD